MQSAPRRPSWCRMLKRYHTTSVPPPPPSLLSSSGSSAEQFQAATFTRCQLVCDKFRLRFSRESVMRETRNGTRGERTLLRPSGGPVAPHDFLEVPADLELPLPLTAPPAGRAPCLGGPPAAVSSSGLSLAEGPPSFSSSGCPLAWGMGRSGVLPSLPDRYGCPAGGHCNPLHSLAARRVLQRVDWEAEEAAARGPDCDASALQSLPEQQEPLPDRRNYAAPGGCPHGLPLTDA